MNVDSLIKEGELLEAKAESINYGSDKVLSGVEYETWTSKVILYLESSHPESSLTKKAIDVNKELTEKSYQKYQFLLGTLKAVKEFDENFEVPNFM
ncbi:hypothetical protein [Bacillus cabrialesii]|uniref:hypothetical protein n=1 Tax=Bacillus cabrialesii TaxID=2487276 RepID=UPI0028F917BC|nr:hypothetical protein [Bacillus cabrialesii]MDU0154459.1 hypothetical protein [Bacillus cabrialesii]